MLTGCGFLPWAYPHFWDYTKTKPNETDLVGSYKVRLFSGSFGSAYGFQGNKNITLTIHRNHTAVLSSMPGFEDSQGQYKVICTFSGAAVWQLDDHGDPDHDVWYWETQTGQWVRSRKNTSGPCNGWEFLILSRQAPYRLDMTVGDPDEDTGIEFERTER